MSSKNSRFALAAALAALSLPAFAGDVAPSSISGDPTWPAIENPAPAIAVRAQGGEVQALLADPLFPATDSAAPALAAVAVPDDGGPQNIDEGAPAPSYAIRLSTPKAAEHVAAVR
jgi:hypothetical protein